jgi:hypothetical protein
MQLKWKPKADLILFFDHITQEEYDRVRENWACQPGPEAINYKLVNLSEAFSDMTKRETDGIRETFGEDWEKWDGEFDEYGRMLPVEGE